MGIRAVLIAVLLPVAAAHAEAPAARDGATAPHDARQPAAKKERRLKFKGNGPQCICANALGEADIQAAAAAGRGPTTESPSTRSGK